MHIELSKASSQYGSNMGRPETHNFPAQEMSVSLTIVQLAWKDSDYDTGGAYWGFVQGEHIYQVTGTGFDGDPIELYRRAKSFSEVEAGVLAEYPLATFTRETQDTDERTHWFSTGSGRIELEMTLTQAKAMSHGGRCDDDVESGKQVPSIQSQLDKIDPKILRQELKEYGAWDAKELSDHSANLDRILWLAAGDIVNNAGSEDEAEDE